MKLWKSIVGKLWMTIIGLVALVLAILGMFLLQYIDVAFSNSHDVKLLFIYTGIIGFLLTTFFAFFLSTKITEPLLQLIKAVDRISKGDLLTRVRYRSTDELGQLANAFNMMAEKLQETITDLSHEKEQLGSILRSMNDAVITLDAAGRVVLANPRGQTLLREWQRIGVDADAGPPPEGDTDTMSPPTVVYAPEPLRELFDTVVSRTSEMTAKLHVRQGVYSVVITPLYSADGVRGAVAVLRDVTEEHRLDKLRKDFVANVSHELRTPLSMLQGYSEALLDDIASTPEERNELVRVIHDESLRMGRLVHNLLDLARMEAGHLEMRCEEVELREVAERVVRKFSALAKEQGVQLKPCWDDEDFRLYCADEDRLEQVLTNLLDNAITHTPSGKAISLRMRGGKDEVAVEVADEGTGIKPEDLPYIFERFYKADKARTRGSGGGTGIGLAIVKNIIDAHQGKITVNSTPGEGTTFSITLPRRTQKSDVQS